MMQLPNSLVTTQGTATGLQSQTPTLQQPQQPGAPVPKSPFQLNALRPQDQQNQLLQFQQQLPAHFGLGAGANSLQLPGQPGTGGSMGFQGSQPGMLEGVSGDNQGNSGFGPAEGRE